MSDIIPFFYADLIARMIPGALFLALFKVGNVSYSLLKPAAASDGANTIITPLIYAGLGYLVGTILEVLLNRPLERIYICTFTRAASDYPWSHCDKSVLAHEPRKARELSRAAFGRIVLAKTEVEKQAFPHLIRFHAEAKMFHAIALISFLFFLVGLALPSTFVPHIGEGG